MLIYWSFFLLKLRFFKCSLTCLFTWRDFTCYLYQNLGHCLNKFSQAVFRNRDFLGRAGAEKKIWNQSWGKMALLAPQQCVWMLVTGNKIFFILYSISSYHWFGCNLNLIILSFLYPFPIAGALALVWPLSTVSCLPSAVLMEPPT